MTYADLMALLGNWLLPGSLIAIMASMGLSLTADDFRQVFRNRRALIFGVCSMLIVPPAIGLTLALTVAPTEDASLSRLTIVTTGSDEIIEQITKQLNKLVDVVKVVDLSEAAHIERELMLIKVRATGKDREEMKRMADIYRGRIIDVTDSTYVIELTGSGSKLDSFIEAIDADLILETVRTGVSGIGRGDRILKA